MRDKIAKHSGRRGRSVTTSSERKKPRNSHIFARDEHDHYVEPEWVSERLFDVEQFQGPILDPACGWSRILTSARKHGYRVRGSDIANRVGARHPDFRVLDFLMQQDASTWQWWANAGSCVSNPPFDKFKEFYRQASALGFSKIAMLWLVRRLNAATWLQNTPLEKIYLLTPRPSMPTGAHILSGGKVGGGKQDFCWLVWSLLRQSSSPALHWLHRDAS